MLLIRYVRDRKGIRGCLVVDCVSGNMAYSLCNKLDRHKSTKKLARQIAIDRLMAGKIVGYIDFMSGCFVRHSNRIIPSKIYGLIKKIPKRMPLAGESKAPLLEIVDHPKG